TAARPMARNTNTGVNDMEAPSVLDGPGPGRGLVTTGCCARPSPTAVAWPAVSPRPGSLIPARPAPATLHCTVAAPRSGRQAQVVVQFRAAAAVGAAGRHVHRAAQQGGLGCMACARQPRQGAPAP